MAGAFFALLFYGNSMFGSIYENFSSIGNSLYSLAIFLYQDFKHLELAWSLELYYISIVLLFNCSFILMLNAITMQSYLKLRNKFKSTMDAVASINKEKSTEIYKKWINMILCRDTEPKVERFQRSLRTIVKNNVYNLKVSFGVF
jgi:hypothetical protein